MDLVAVVWMRHDKGISWEMDCFGYLNIYDFLGVCFDLISVGSNMIYCSSCFVWEEANDAPELTAIRK